MATPHLAAYQGFRAPAMDRPLSFCNWSDLTKMSILVALSFLPLLLRSQAYSIDQQVIGASGNTGTHSLLEYSYTLGETVILTLQAPASGTILTQGFHQPNAQTTVSTTPTGNDPGWRVRLFPNPTSGQLSLELEPELLIQNLIFTVYDQNGRTVSSETSIIQSTLTHFDCRNLSAGTYQIRLYSRKSGQWKTLPFIKVK